MNRHIGDIKLTARLLWQEKRINQIPNLNNLFHNPQPNNYVWMLIPKNKNLSTYRISIKRQTSYLNRADEMLFHSYLLLIDKLGFSSSCNIHNMVEKWRLLQSSGLNLDTIYFAEKIAYKIMKKLPDLIFSEVLKNETPEIFNAFINIPSRLKSLLRINFHIPHEYVLSCLTNLLKEIYSDDKSLEQFIDRIEIAKIGLDNTSDIKYPTLILYLSSNTNDVKNIFRVRILTQIIAKVAMQYPYPIEMNSEYADPWLYNTTVTQGFRLYKRYLALLSMLSNVYEKCWNYAYLCGSEQKNCIPSILTDTRQY